MITLENKKLILSGRVDSGNAAQFEQELFAAWQGEEAVIDAEKLEYISSAGLRVLMKLRKKTPNVTLENVSTEVYDIFEVTGFTEMLTVKKALRFVSVEGLKFLGRGAHGKVYKISDDMIIKVYHDGSPLELIEKERQFGKTAFVAGIPCAIAFDVVRCEEGYGLIYEMAGASSLAGFLEAHPEKLQEYSLKFANLLKSITELEADTTLYDSIKELYLQRIDNAARFFTEEEIATLKKMINCIQDRTTLLHTDYHPGNVMVNAEGELLLVDMADISYGNPIYDVGGSFMIMVLAGRNNPDTIKKQIGIDMSLTVPMWNTLASVYYGTTDPQKLELITKRCAAFALLRMTTMLGMEMGGDSAQRRDAGASKMVEIFRAQLFPNAEGFCRLLAMEP